MEDDKMTDATLSLLKTMHADVRPSSEARKAAVNLAVAAFDAAQAKGRAGAKGEGWFSWMRLDNSSWRVALGTAAIALVALPLGMQLYNTTSLTNAGTPDVVALPPNSVVATSGRTDGLAAPADQPVGDDRLAAQTATTEAAVTAPPAPMTVAPEEEARERDIDFGLANTAPLAKVENKALSMPRAEPMATFADQSAAGATSSDALGVIGEVAPSGGRAAWAPSGVDSSVTVGDSSWTTAIPLVETGDVFSAFEENRLMDPSIPGQETSTFSIDVDTASYSYVRSVLQDGYVPDPDAVRLEELINYFPYNYAAPTSLDTPFKATMQVMPSPWNAGTQLLEIGIKGYVPTETERQPQNLTFLIDSSGSMDEPNKLPLLKRSFGLLIDQLRPEDTVSIVTYAGSAGIQLPPTKASERTTILEALNHLGANGSTAGAEGIELAYKLAEESKIANGVNRVILATDGDFNVGISDPEDLKNYIKSKRDSGVFLSVLGFGRGNLDDALMQALAQNGNGNASYIDSFAEARKVLVEEGGANLITIAKDVKIQVEFNPAVVAEYRLIGYETRALNREDFNNDAVDAGEIGAGHTVTALYEITPVGSDAVLNDELRYQANSTAETAFGDEIGFLKMRYKTPDGDVSQLITTPIEQSLVVDTIAEAGEDQRFAAAVAAFGQKLKASNYGEDITWEQIQELAHGAEGEDENGYRAEFLQLIQLAALLVPEHVGHSVCDDPNGGKPGCPVPAE